MDFTIISKYRGELMGIGILDVLLLHFFTLNNMPLPRVASIIIDLVFVQGFLFLSGFGLYYSFTKDNNLIGFYKRRFMSVVIPYLVIALPYYTYFLFTGQLEFIPVYSESYFILNNPWISWLGRVTTIGYWIEGNFNGMWYLALTIFLYTLFPLLYKALELQHGGGKNTFVWLLIIAIAVKVGFLVNYLSPSYYKTIVHSLLYAYMFLIGMMFGKWSFNKVQIDFEILLVVGLLCWIAPDFRTIIAMLLICYFFEIIDLSDKMRCVLRWLGNYSLEIYVLHLSLYALFALIENNNSLEVPFYYNIAVVYACSLLIAVAVRRVSLQIKAWIV